MLDPQLWYESLRDVCPRTLFISLTEAAVSYLLSDGIFMPEECHLHWNNASYSSDEDDIDWDKDDDNRSMDPRKLLPKLNAVVDSAIMKLGGSVFPKLVDCAPIDSTWITLNRTLKCSSFLEIMLVLKSSTCCADKLSSQHPHCLQLKKWIDIPESGEFRCFVKGQKLIAISQRNVNVCYLSILTEKMDIMLRIKNFFFSHVQNCLSNFEDYIVDVCLMDAQQIMVIDVSEYNTNSLLLFDDQTLVTLTELAAMSADSFEPEIRLIESECDVEIPVHSSALPDDLYDILDNGDPDKLVDLVAFKVQELLNIADTDDD